MWRDLSDCPLIERLEEDRLRRLFESLALVEVPAGQILAEKGERMEKMFVIAEGMVEALAVLPNGKETAIRGFGPGQMIGDRALLEHQPWPTVYRAGDACFVLELDSAGAGAGAPGRPRSAPVPRRPARAAQRSGRGLVDPEARARPDRAVALLPIRLYPDPVLRRRCPPVASFDDELRRLAADMIETMHAAPGIGLAAPQVGVETRLAVVDLSAGEDPEAVHVLVNPRILASDGRRCRVRGLSVDPGPDREGHRGRCASASRPRISTAAPTVRGRGLAGAGDLPRDRPSGRHPVRGPLAGSAQGEGAARAASACARRAR